MDGWTASGWINGWLDERTDKWMERVACFVAQEKNMENLYAYSTSKAPETNLTTTIVACILGALIGTVH